MGLGSLNNTLRAWPRFDGWFGKEQWLHWWIGMFGIGPLILIFWLLLLSRRVRCLCRLCRSRLFQSRRFHRTCLWPCLAPIGWRLWPCLWMISIERDVVEALSLHFPRRTSLLVWWASTFCSPSIAMYSQSLKLWTPQILLHFIHKW